jgi:Ca2+-binding EF-hand superfamily protein
MENFMKKDQILEYIKEIDKDGDGEIDFQEFIEMMSNFG